MSKKRMTELKPDVLKKLQETQLEILDEIVRICEKYGLHYFLMFGTLIGAIRHKGFIPWDDDLDIGMPRDDYDKFMEVAKTELDERFYLQNSDTEPRYWLSFANVRKNNTLFDEASLAKMPEDIHKGIFVDIFPLDYVKKNSGLFVHVQFVLSKAINETMYYKAGVYANRKALKYKTLGRLLAVFSLRTLCKLQSKVASVQKTNKKAFLADFTSPRKYFMQFIRWITLYLGRIVLLQIEFIKYQRIMTHV